MTAPQTSSLAGSELAAGTTDTIVRLWIGDADPKRTAFWKARMDRAFVEEGPAAAVPVPGLCGHTSPFAWRRAQAGRGHQRSRSRRAARPSKILACTHLFSAFLGYDSVRNPKPAADPVHLACKLLGVAPHEAMVVGDNLHDLDMARNAGAGAAIGVLTGTTGREELASKADAVLPSIADLPKWLADAGR